MIVLLKRASLFDDILSLPEIDAAGVKGDRSWIFDRHAPSIPRCIKPSQAEPVD